MLYSPYRLNGKERLVARILVIDDDPQIVKLLNKFLVFMGHEVTTASNGKEGLNILAGTRFDLLITDIIMPERDGIEVLIAIKGMPDRPKIIAMSGGAPNLDQEHLLKMATLMNADKVLAKPLQLTTLSTVIQEILGDQ